MSPHPLPSPHPQELRLTALLFGSLVQQQLVSSITLGIALRYVGEYQICAKGLGF